jgi:hypothetical protein
LFSDAHDPTRPTAALAKVAIVEGEHAEPRVVEAPGEQVRGRLLGYGEAASHDHAPAVGAGVMPRGAHRVAARKTHLVPLDGLLLLHIELS